MMVARRRGLIVNLGFWAAQKYVGNAIYGIAKAATDKMSSDMAHELRPSTVAVVSLYPGLARTEAVMEAARGGWLDISNSESPEFIGRVIAALSRDPQLMERSGRIVVAAQLAQELNVRDIDGRQPNSTDSGVRLILNRQLLYAPPQHGPAACAAFPVGQTLGQTASFRQTAPETWCQSRVCRSSALP
jgi:NAD(P)-dependent dehydrogenase (short-subunit alcohol dehydrogenase family)